MEYVSLKIFLSHAPCVYRHNKEKFVRRMRSYFNSEIFKYHWCDISLEIVILHGLEPSWPARLRIWIVWSTDNDITWSTLLSSAFSQIFHVLFFSSCTLVLVWFAFYPPPSHHKEEYYIYVYVYLTDRQMFIPNIYIWIDLRCVIPTIKNFLYVLFCIICLWEL